MGTFDALELGLTFETPSRRIAESDLQTLVDVGGYTHPLFADPDFAAHSRFGRRPLPGQGLLLLMGGLVEQSGRFDDTVVALLGFVDVRFLKPAFAGDEIRVEVEVVGKEPRVVLMRWTCVRADGEHLAETFARMLFKPCD